jgi:hypothetical protein
MDLADAVERANRILIEERVRPTVRYYDRVLEHHSLSHSDTVAPKAMEVMLRLTQSRTTDPRYNLDVARKIRPRHVDEFPGDFVFQSANYDLLTVIFGQLAEADRSEFISSLLVRLSSPAPSMRYQGSPNFPTYEGCVSELPLVAEFVVRRGYVHALLDALGSVEEPTIGLVILLYQLEEMIALKFTIVSDHDLKLIPKKLNPLWMELGEMEEGLKKRPNNPDGGKGGRRELGLVREMRGSIRSIIEEVRTARHYYLKNELLQENPNLEIESDKKTVNDSLEKLGFDKSLIATLRKAEEQYRATSDVFEIKECLLLVRTFFEHLHIQTASSIATSLGTTVVDEWDPSVTFLANKGYLSKQQEKFARGLYTLTSDEGVHPLIAEREFVRVSRNMVIEYGLMFLKVLEKKGVKII